MKRWTMGDRRWMKDKKQEKGEGRRQEAVISD